MQLADALSLLLPDSLLFPVLSTLPLPDPTNPTASSIHPMQTAVHNTLPIIEELVSLYEREEAETVDREVTKRRTRLGAAGPEQIRREVNCEVLESSRLPHLYDEILNHPNTSDELRRTTESKLLRLKQRLLNALPAAQKAKVAAELDELVSGMVLLGIRDELAWTLFIENKDAEHIEDYDFNVVGRLCRLFPESHLAQLITAYFGYMSIEIPDEEEESKQEQAKGDIDYVDIIIEAFGSLADSILAHRIVAEIYQSEEDLENTIKVAESGLELVRRAERDSGKSLSHVRKAFNTALATSLVHYYPPKHHARALGLLNDVLTEDADNVPCLMGRGYVLQYAGKWSDASELYAKVIQLVPDDLEHGVRAREEHAWCEANLHHLENASAELQEVNILLDDLEGRDVDKARSWWRLGKCYWDMGDEHREEAYRHFITSLKRSPSFAPAFTSLGIYYFEFVSPPDPNRASKCFQKAFELDPREAEAARRLAEGFAEEREWDLVEVVARRTIDGEGGLEGGTATARYLPINAWAWKAIGVVELNRQNYPQAIQGFQIALRTDVDDQLSWLRLGEAYSKAGRFAAAVKALERARELNPEDWICSYFIGEVQRQTGQYQEAIVAFESILTKHPHELGVLVSLGQAHLDLGRMHVTAAYTARAESSFTSAVQVALQMIIEASSGFRRVAWKIVADAVFHLSQFTQFSDEDLVLDVLYQLVPFVSDHPGESLTGIVTLPLSLQKSANLPLSALEIAVAAYNYRISLDALDETAVASAHYDLSAALFSYSRKASAKQQLAKQEATKHIKDALRAEPGNDRYWNALGNMEFESRPKIAQHAYVKALEINSKSTITWTNLGLLYLHHGDTELANEAFYKAQTLDPDYALAWVGQGLVASLNGHAPEARALFEHAVGLSAPVPDADVEFAKRVFSQLNTTAQTRPSQLDAISPAFFVLDRFCRGRPHDASALHLFGLVCERIGHIELGIDIIGRAIVLLEAAYEDTEDPVVERRFSIAHTNMARLRLSVQDYEGALESYQVVTGLLPEDSEDRSARILLTQARFGAGLAQFKLGQLAEALALFEAALDTAADEPDMRGHVIVMLAQTLWAMGTEEGRESAKAQLLQSIESDPDNLLAINTLAGMGILTDDDSLVDAALSEILALPPDQRLARDPDREVTYLLVQHHLGQGDVQQALSVSQKAVIVEPSRPEIRQTLAELVLQQGDGEGSLAVLAATHQESLAQQRDSLYLRAIARCVNAKTQEEAHQLAHKAVMLTPWDKRNWQALAFVKST